MSRHLEKELMSLRHRAKQLSDALSKININDPNQHWKVFLDQFKVICQQLAFLQRELAPQTNQISKFVIQPTIDHFDCTQLGIKKIPQIEIALQQRMESFTQMCINLQTFNYQIKSQKQESQNDTTTNEDNPTTAMTGVE
ncbi:hypothetical protein RFI_28929 [Reticulomyxa filosa]|uniref:Uncharacterized protein n=1 Tax=Reticulomyxa filosa TaxID=46433 RepID=X6M4R9_RETFI|nr:hypothetical protein RFI_28929 [Reticulomyxa filosa]|eukprot:ETO08457.1 hypothetical protein RFI_28929 [Reticulomyxa filosa]